MIHARIAAALFIILLFTIGSLPAAGQAFPGVMHWIAHLLTYSLIAFACAHGWPQRPAMQIAALVAAVGAVHEATEIITHRHGYEWEDVVVNAVGALIGVSIQRTVVRKIAR